MASDEFSQRCNSHLLFKNGPHLNMPCNCKTDKVVQIGHDFKTTIFTTFILITRFIYTNTTDKLPKSIIIITIRLFKTN